MEHWSIGPAQHAAATGRIAEDTKAALPGRSGQAVRPTPARPPGRGPAGATRGRFASALLNLPASDGAAPSRSARRGADPAPIIPARAASAPPRPQLVALPLPPQQALQAARRAMPQPQLLNNRLAEAEGGADAPCQGYTLRNASSGAIGRYQMLPVALRDIGWQDAQGRWTERAAAAGVRSEAEFLANPAAQEAAMARYLDRAEQQLAANGAIDHAGQALRGLDGRPIPLTRAGLVAAAHRRGAGAVASWIRHRTETPQAPLSRAQRQAFAQIEIRLRDFADIRLQSA